MAEAEKAAEVPPESQMEEKKEEPHPPPQPELETMRSIVLMGHGGYSKVQVQKYAKPKPMQGQVVVRVHACGLNFADLMQRQGLYSAAPKPPYVGGLECSGTVEELGEGVTGLEVGARVVCFSGLGNWTEYACVDAGLCFVMPDDMSFEDGAAMPVNYLTGYLMLFHLANLGKRKSILIHMAAGGVGIAATQLCKTVEGVTIFGTSSAAKHEVITEVGVHHPIDYRTTDYVQAVRKVNPEGVDIILDPLGSPDTKKCYDLLKPMGVMICFGSANSVAESKGMFSSAKNWLKGMTLSPPKMMSDNKSVSGFHLGRIRDKQLLQDAMTALFKLYTEGAIKPRIDEVFAFEDIAKAMKRMHQRKNIGKILLSPMKEPEPEPEPARKNTKSADAEPEKPAGEAEAKAEEGKPEGGDEKEEEGNKPDEEGGKSEGEGGKPEGEGDESQKEGAKPDGEGNTEEASADADEAAATKTDESKASEEAGDAPEAEAGPADEAAASS